MKIINALLLSALYLILVAPTSAAEFTVSGMIHKTTCSIDDSTSNTIKLPDVKVGLLKVGVPQSASSGGALSITVSCKDPDASMAFEGRFTTKGEVDPTTLALKNILTTESGGAQDIGVQIIDTASSTVIEPNAPESQEAVATATLDAGKATFNFDFAYVNLGNAGTGDVRVEATFIATYL
ncbi:fimbrial protein [Citrobacter freundii]|nr:fimbrial protein [Citrobacter freundii]HEE0106107.1 fimbrial protein [Citrobacter gillenii]MBA8030635.1 fimbrial protein [Citrobacter freundii]QLO05557.1 fimbrial protein [Citrobacter freundii]QLU68212.1 fimbrial protein [Citrobacter freundii]WFZ84062.1 fimbrial protein [Citrobacter freundii]